MTFIGGPCLRTCYGSQRLSGDLDFTGGAGFTREGLADLSHVLVERLEVKYGLPIEVSEPQRETGNIDTWKLRDFARPAQKHLPIQRINIGICALPSHDRKPMMLRNHYGVEMGTSGLIQQAQSREEILADKMVALALRPNRLKSRDLWDIVWLNRQGITLPVQLVLQKAMDRRQEFPRFLEQLQQRIMLLQSDPAVRKDFWAEMRRFLPPAVFGENLGTDEFWTYLIGLVTDEGEKVRREA